MLKPEKIPFFEFYLTPVVRLVAAAGDVALVIYQGLAGRWYCEYCKQYHSRRTAKKRRYMVWQEDDCVCSLAFEKLEGTK